MSRKLKIGLLSGILVLVLAVGAGLCWWLVANKTETEPIAETETVKLDMPESEYNVYCVLTESPIRYASDGVRYEIDTFSFDQNKEMTLLIDEDGIIPLEGRVYRVYVPKEGEANATFAVPITSGGTDKMDFSRRVIPYRDSDWMYIADRSVKFRVTEDSTFYYVKVMDGMLRRTDATKVDSLSKFGSDCPDKEKHAHKNSCFYYNCYVKFDGGFLEDYDVVWTALSTDGYGIYNYAGTEEDTEKAILPGQEASRDKLVVTTTDKASNGTIGVKDFTGKTYTCKVNKEGVQPVGGRVYHIEKQEDGTVTFSTPVRSGNNYDFYTAPVVSKEGETVEVKYKTEKTITEDTQILQGSTFWTGWLSLDNVNANSISMAQRTNTCKKKEAHTHTNSCYFYNALYKGDGYEGLSWIMTQNEGYSLSTPLGKEDSIEWGSGDPKNTALVTKVNGNKATFMAMDGTEYTCTYAADKELPVYEGALYHVEWKNQSSVTFTKVNTSVTTPGFDCTLQPLCQIDGNQLIFGEGDDQKPAQITSDTKFYYMAAGDKRLIPMSAGELQTAKHTNTCLTKGEHEHTNGCYFYNTIFGCDGLGNIKWMICSAKNGSLSGVYGNANNLVKQYEKASNTCFTLSAVKSDGKLEVLLMDGTRGFYEVHPDGFTPVKGRIYACELKDGKLLFSKPNDNAKHFTRSAVVEATEDYVTVSDRNTFRLTDDTLIFSIGKSNDKLVLLDEKTIGISLSTDYCKGLGEGHEHVWNKCYNNNVLYATDGAGNLIWLLVRADGNYISTSYIGDTKEEVIKAGSASNVFFTTSNIILKDGKLWIKGMDMTGKELEGELSEDSLMPLIGSMYHVEMKDDKICLSNPNTDHKTMGYDLGRRPLYQFNNNVVQLVTGEKYYVTSNTKIFNVVMENGALKLTEGTELPEALCHCEKDHKHVNDCYNYNMFFAADDSDELTWIMTAPADTGMFAKCGLTAIDYTESGEAENVAVTTSHAYPVWTDGKKEIYVNIIKMNGETDTVKVDQSGVIPCQGKGYHIAYNADNSVLFSIADVSGSGNDFIRYQAAMADDTHVVLRNGKLLTVTANTKIFETEAVKKSNTDQRINSIQEATTITASNAKSTCQGAEHSHVEGCFEAYSIWYSCDADGNLNWIISEKTGSQSIYYAVGAKSDKDISAASFTSNSPIAFVIKAPYDSNGKKVVDLKDIFGTVYEGVEVSADVSLRAGMPYKVSIDNNVATLTEFDGDLITRIQGVSYADGELTAQNSKNYKITSNTQICYVEKNSNNTFTVLEEGDSRIPANGFPENPTGYNVIMNKVSGGNYVQWMLVEVYGLPMYYLPDWYDIKETVATTPESIVLTTGNAYPEWSNGTKVVKVPVTDMTGKEMVLTLSNADSITIVPGKIYGVTYDTAAGTAALEKCESKVYRGKVTNQTEDLLTIRTSGDDYNVRFTENAYKYQVVLNDTTQYRLTMDGTGIGPNGSAYNAIFGTNAQGDITFILTTTDGKTAYYSIYGAQGNPTSADTPDVIKPTFETTPIAFVIKAPYLKDGKYVVDLKDIYGVEHLAMPFDYTSTDYPKLNLPYKVTITDGVATLEKLTTNMTRSEKFQSYSNGVLTRTDSNPQRTYTITADTYICYVDKNGSTMTMVDSSVGLSKANGGITVNAFNTIMSNNSMQAPTTSGDYIQWMLVEINGESIYNLTDTSKGWYTVSNRPTRLASELMLMTSDLTWDAENQKYLIEAVDMNGKEYKKSDGTALEYTYVNGDADKSSGVIPVKGKIFVVTTQNDIVKFSWASVISIKDSNYTKNAFYDVIQGSARSYDDSANTVTLSNSTVYSLEKLQTILGVKRYDTNGSYFVDYKGIKTSIKTNTSGDYNIMLGFDETYHISWLINNSENTSSISNIANNGKYTAPNLEDLKNQ